MDHVLGDEHRLLLDREVARVNQVELRVWQVTEVRYGADRGEGRVVLAQTMSVGGCCFRRNACQAG